MAGYAGVFFKSDNRALGKEGRGQKQSLKRFQCLNARWPVNTMVT